jgi:2-methylcitrate dehydratase PrpD
MRRDANADARLEKQGSTLTRRSLLQRTGLALAATALPPAAGASPRPANPTTAGGSVMATLSSYMSEARGRALPDEAVEKAKHHILDTLAAMISGSELLPGRQAIKFVRGYGGEKVATVAGSDVLCGPIEAALANGMLAHSDETDDSHAPSQSHPGCAIVPAALAAGEKFGIDGQQFLRAVALGYDVGPRVTMTLGAEPYEHDSHRSTHSIATNFGAAAAAGCAANLNAHEMRWLLDYAAQQSSGLANWAQDTDHIVKAFNFAGMGARNGVTAALVVQSGWTGVDDIFSGADNFFLAYAPQADPAGLVDKLGERYEVARTDIKKWAAGMPVQAALDAVDNIRKRRPFEAGQVQQVTVRLANREVPIVNNREMPDVCLQHMIAVMLIDKTLTFRSSHDRARMQDAATLRERAKVHLIPDEELERLMPRRQAIVEITLTDGTRLSEHVDAVRGTAHNPMPREEVIAKAHDLVTPVLGAEKCAGLVERISGLETVKDVRELRPLLQRA